MLKRKAVWSTLALAAALGLGACGGGSSSGGGTGGGGTGGGGNPPPPDPDPNPTVETITISGFVTDMPIPNATVVITVDGQSFEAPVPTGADGSYSVEIESEDPDAMVICEAFDPNGAVRFTSLLNNFAGFQALADDDGVVADADITNVTTAQYVLATRLAGDGSIDSLDELEDLSAQVDTEDLLEVSAAIKLVVESMDGIVLPDGYDDVQDLAEAIVAGDSTFLADVELTNPGALAAAIDAVLEDGNATLTFDADYVPGVYVAPNDFSVFAFFPGGDGVAMNYAEDDAHVLPAWSVTEDGRLRIDYEDGARDTVTLLGRSGNVLNLVVDFEEVSGESESDAVTAYRFGFAGGFDAATMPGSYTMIEDPSEVTVFLPDGSGYSADAATGFQDDQFTWDIDAAGVLHITDLDDGDTSMAYRLEGAEDGFVNVFTVETDSTGDVEEAGFFTVSYSEEFFTGPTGDPTNTDLLAGKTYALTEPNDVGLFTFGADGSFHEVAQFFDDGFWEFYEDEGAWLVDENGVITTIWDDDDDDEAEPVTVVNGLGEDFMTVESPDDAAGESVTVTRVAPFDADSLPGTYAFMIGGQSDGETIVFEADSTGYYADGGVLEDSFTWTVAADGRLVLTLDDEGFDVATDSYHLLADSSDDILHAVFVFRVNGELDGDVDEGSNEAPAAVEEVNLLRQD